jgi:hypothetical protein
MKTEHTQGPWQRVSDKPFLTAFCKETDRPEIVATIYSHSEEVKEWEANARLIAAAPDLLAVLKSLVFETSHFVHGDGTNGAIVANELRNAIATIAKADGNA